MAPKQKLYDKMMGISANEIWQIYLNEGVPGLQKRAPFLMRTMMYLESGFLKNLPSNPRCIWCYAPFRGLGAPFMRALGKGQSRLNPNVCVDCEHFIRDHSGGAEVELTMLFADIRGSTKLAENISPSAFSQIINRFFTVSTEKLIMANALIEKLIGDEVTAFFVPGLAGKEHARQAIDAAKEVLLATGHGDPEGPWVPVGIGVHSGVAYVGVVGHTERVSDITVLGDVANTAARLASAAQPGEIIVSDTSSEMAGIDTSGLETRVLDLKGKSEPFKTWVVVGGIANSQNEPKGEKG